MEVHHGKNDHTILINLGFSFPDTLKWKLPLCGGHATEPVQEFLLQSNELRLDDWAAVVVVERQVDVDASN
jgi:hypothetical protein